MKHKCLIFSKDRAAQLLVLLETLQRMCVDYVNLNIVVLYAVSNTGHSKQYDLLKSLYKNVEFKLETNFKIDVENILVETEFISLFVDDCVVTQKFTYSSTLDILEKNEDSIGFSLRLGKNTTYCYASNVNQVVPILQNVNEDIVKFNWTNAGFDFGYPIDLSSSVYKTSIILTLMKDQRVNGPNLLEHLMYCRCRMFEKVKPNLLCFNTSKAFCIPLNVVNHRNTVNRRCGNSEYSIDNIFNKFDMGLKIDIQKFIGKVPNSCHLEESLSWIPRVE